MLRILYFSFLHRTARSTCRIYGGNPPDPGAKTTELSRAPRFSLRLASGDRIRPPEEVQGAFYVYADISAFSENSEQFCHDMLENHGVAITPGTDFGDFKARQFVRFAFTTSMDDLALGVERLRCALQG